MRAGSDHTEQQVGPVVLQGATEHLLVHWDGRRALDVAKGMDRGTNAEIADTLDTDVRRLVLAAIAILAVLDRDLGEPNTNSANVAAQDVAAIEGLARPNCIIKTFKVDCRHSVSYRYPH